MAGLPPRDPTAREQARRLRAQQVRRRRLVFLAAVGLLVILIVVLLVVRPGCGEAPDATTTTSSTSPGTGQTTTTLRPTHTAELSGADNVPPVDTASTGLLSLNVDPAESTVHFLLEVDGLTNTSSAYICEGAPGSIGEAVVLLFDGPTIENAYSGKVAEGDISLDDLMGRLEGKSIADLITLLQSGDAYCRVGNTSYPDGAIRGQIK